MSDHEIEVLERLEQEFQPSLPAEARTRWSRVAKGKRLAVGAAGLQVGVGLMAVAVALDDAVGIALAVLAYVLVVASAAALVGCRSETPGARRERRARRGARPLRFFQ